MTPKALWSRAGLMVRLQPPTPDPKVFWWHHSMTIDDARELVLQLNLAIEAGVAHLAELRERKAS